MYRNIPNFNVVFLPSIVLDHGKVGVKAGRCSYHHHTPGSIQNMDNRAAVARGNLHCCVYPTQHKVQVIIRLLHFCLQKDCLYKQIRRPWCSYSLSRLPHFWSQPRVARRWTASVSRSQWIQQKKLFSVWIEKQKKTTVSASVDSFQCCDNSEVTFELNYLHTWEWSWATLGNYSILLTAKPTVILFSMLHVFHILSFLPK